jgi:hypothetical protein
MLEKVGTISDINSLAQHHAIIQRRGKPDTQLGFKKVKSADECRQIIADVNNKLADDKNSRHTSHFIYNKNSGTCFDVLQPNSSAFKKFIREYKPDSLNSDVLHYSPDDAKKNAKQHKIEISQQKMDALKGTINSQKEKFMEQARKIALLQDPSLNKNDLEEKAEEIVHKELNAREYKKLQDLQRKIQHQSQELAESNKTLLNVKQEINDFQDVMSSVNTNYKKSAEEKKLEIAMKNKQVSMAQNMAGATDSMSSILYYVAICVFIIAVLSLIYLASKYYSN